MIGIVVNVESDASLFKFFLRNNESSLMQFLVLESNLVAEKELKKNCEKLSM